MKTITFLLLIVFTISSCEIKTNAPSGKKETASKSGSKFRNGIQLKETGLKVEQAYLVNEEGSLISNENKIDVNQKVILKMLMGGWKEEAGKVYIGAKEKLTTSEGNIILDTDDLFIDYPEGVSAADAKIITLSAVITKLDKPYDFIVVEFRVWDKKGGGEVTGSYKLYLV